MVSGSDFTPEQIAAKSWDNARERIVSHFDRPEMQGVLQVVLEQNPGWPDLDHEYQSHMIKMASDFLEAVDHLGGQIVRKPAP